MKLYLLEQSENEGDGAILSCVVVAENKEEAKEVHPYGDWDRVEVWSYESDAVKATYLGTARKDIEKAGFSKKVNNVICVYQSYNQERNEMSQETVAEDLKEKIYECLALALAFAEDTGDWNIHNALTLARMSIDELVTNESR